MLSNGRWSAKWHPVQATNTKRALVRQTSGFRNWVTPTGDSGTTGTGGFKAELGRYHLYVAVICPCTSRTLIGHKLQGLEDAISISVVEPQISEQGWRFGNYPEWDHDELNGATRVLKPNGIVPVGPMTILPPPVLSPSPKGADE